METENLFLSVLLFYPFLIGGISTESDCAFEPDYAVPPLPVSEGMQHIRIMEGMSRSLPSSPLLTHQSISVRLQPAKKLTGKNFTKLSMFKRELESMTFKKKKIISDMFVCTCRVFFLYLYKTLGKWIIS